MSDNDDYEEREYTVYLDFESYVAPEEFDSTMVDFKIIGIDSEHPIIQVNGKLFRGSYDFCIGTNLFFDEDPNPPVIDPLFDIAPNRFYRLLTKTQKVLKVERIFVEKLRQNTEASDCDLIAALKICKQPNMTYSEALNMLLPEGTAPPRELPAEPPMRIPDPVVFRRDMDEMEEDAEMQEETNTMQEKTVDPAVDPKPSSSSVVDVKPVTQKPV